MALALLMVLVGLAVPSAAHPVPQPLMGAITPNPALVGDALTIPAGTMTGTYVNGDPFTGTISFPSGGTPSENFCPAAVLAGTCTIGAGGAYGPLTVELWWGSHGTDTITVIDSSGICGITCATDSGNFVLDTNLSLSTYMAPFNANLGLTANGLDAGGGTRINVCTLAASTIAGCYGGASGTTATGNYTVGPAGVTIPAEPYGRHVVTLGDNHGATATANFFETASDTLTPNAAVIGTTITVAGGGFSASTPFQVIWNPGPSQVSVASGTTNALGSLPAGVTFKVPFATGGAWPVEVLDANKVSFTTTFTVLDQIFAATPSASGPVGTSFSVTGNGFLASGTVTMEWDGGSSADHVVFGPVITAPNGTLTFTGHTPASWNGAHDILAVPTGGPNNAATPFTTTGSLNLTPTAGPAGGDVSASLGQGLTANVLAYLIWDPGLPDQTMLFSPGMTTNADGSVAFPAWTVPASATPGPHTVEVQDANGLTASATFFVGPWLTLTPSSGVANTSISLSGWVYGVGSTVNIYWNGGSTPLATISVTALSGGLFGNFTATIPAQPSPTGTHAVWANSTTASTSALFTISPHLDASVLSGPVGTVTLLQVQGMAANALTTVEWGGVSTGSSQRTNVLGSALIPFTIPAATAGPHTLTAVDAAGGTTNVRSFTVVPSIVPTTLAAYEGTNVSVQGYGFAGASPVVLMWDGAPVAGTSVMSSAVGSAALTFPVPFAPGAGTLSASDASFDNASALPFTVWALAVPVPVSPLGGVVENSSGVSLIWRGIPSGNVTYNVELSTSPTFGSGSQWWLGVAGTSVAVGPLADGTWYWRVEGVSASGGSAGWSAAEMFQVDVTGVSIALTGPHGTGFWYTGAVTVTVTTTVGDGGIRGTFLSLNGGSYGLYTGPVVINANGWTTVSAYAIADSGLVSPAVTDTFAIDGVVPSTGSNVDTAAGYWYNATDAPVAVTLTATAGPSGVGATYWSLDSAPWVNSTTLTVSGDGVHTLEFYSVSGAGLSGPVQTQLVRIDTGAPTSAAVLTGNLTASGWYASATTLTLSATEPVSGVAATYYANATAGASLPIPAGSWHLYTQALVYTTGEYTVYYRSISNAGNWEAPKSVSFNVDMADTQAPGLAALLAASPQTWSGSVVYTITLTDPAGFTAAWLEIDSGAPQLMSPGTPILGDSSVEFSLSVNTLSLENGEHTVRITAENALGQVTTFGPQHVDVDNVSYGPIALVLGLLVLLFVGLVAFWGTGYRRPTKPKKGEVAAEAEPAPAPSRTPAVIVAKAPEEPPASSDALSASVSDDKGGMDEVAPNPNPTTSPRISPTEYREDKLAAPPSFSEETKEETGTDASSSSSEGA
jgi:hypothetical protein